ncbi:transposase IS66 family protein [Escherichia coli DEC8D]|nr:transposase IS66 family protein [Escherichia coli DEC8D]
MLARVLISKYAEHTPLYRQSEMYGRQGVELSRSLLSGWVDACCRLLSPLEEALQDYVLTDGKLHADDTPVPVLLPGNKKTKTGRLWTYVRDDRNAGSTLAPAVLSLTARTEKASIRRPILRGSVVYCRRMHTPGSTSCTGMAG